MKKLLSSLFFVISLGVSYQVSASLILEQYDSGSLTPDSLGGYAMTDFTPTGSNTGTSTQVAAPGGGFVEFFDKNDNILALSNNTADSTTNNNTSNTPSSWWVNGENFDYDIYTTDENLIVLKLPVDTLAFSFNVGADLGWTGENAWLLATESEGLGIATKHRFNVSRANTPGFGIYADNGNGSCSTITSVTIEPDYWGTGNFSIHQGSCEVPEPSIIALFAAGLFGLGFARRRTNN